MADFIETRVLQSGIESNIWMLRVHVLAAPKDEYTFYQMSKDDLLMLHREVVEAVREALED